MTIFFPDVSSYEAGLRIQPGTVAVVAKASEGTYYTDADYHDFKNQAGAVGAIFSAYHFLKAGNGAGQADYCHAIVGSTPVMLDVETEGASRPTVADCAAFIARMHQLGGRVWGVYFPRWYHDQVGGDLASLGVALIASGYPGGYSDTDANWNAYGGKTPDIWQYTDKQPYGGMSVDFNAYRGSVAQLAALITGATPTPSTPTVSLNIVRMCAHEDPAKPQGKTTNSAQVEPVQRALEGEGLLNPSDPRWGRGAFGTMTVAAYAAWQRRLGYSGADADGIPGMTSLSKLGAKWGFHVVA